MKRYCLFLLVLLLMGTVSCHAQRTPTDLNPLDEKKKNPSQDTSGSDPANPTAVDTGNPTGVGPKPTGSFRLMMADAPLGDSVKKLIIRPTAVQLFRKKRATGATVDKNDMVEITLPQVKEIDLLAYRDGLKMTLLNSVTLPAGTYEELRVILHPGNPVTIEYADGSQEAPILSSPEVFEGGEESNEIALYGVRTLTIQENELSEMLMHVDVRKQLRRGSELNPPKIGEANQKKYLLPKQDLLSLQEVGGLKGLSLNLLFKVACAYPQGATKDSQSTCFNAAGSAVLSEGKFYFPYLAPGIYELRVFLTDTTYVDHVINGAVAAEGVIEVDLQHVSLPLSLPW